MSTTGADSFRNLLLMQEEEKVQCKGKAVHCRSFLFVTTLLYQIITNN